MNAGVTRKEQRGGDVAQARHALAGRGPGITPGRNQETKRQIENTPPTWTWEEQLIHHDIVRIDLVGSQFLYKPLRLVQAQKLGNAHADKRCLLLFSCRPCTNADTAKTDSQCVRIMSAFHDWDQKEIKSAIKERHRILVECFPFSHNACGVVWCGVGEVKATQRPRSF